MTLCCTQRAAGESMVMTMRRHWNGLDVKVAAVMTLYYTQSGGGRRYNHYVLSGTYTLHKFNVFYGFIKLCSQWMWEMYLSSKSQVRHSDNISNFSSLGDFKSSLFCVLARGWKCYLHFGSIKDTHPWVRNITVVSPCNSDGHMRTSDASHEAKLSRVVSKGRFTIISIRRELPRHQEFAGKTQHHKHINIWQMEMLNMQKVEDVRPKKSISFSTCRTGKTAAYLFTTQHQSSQRT